MDRAIIAFHKDEFNDWVADLACGHTRHVRHNPPWTNREWVLTEEGRSRFIGHKFNCVQCAVKEQEQFPTSQETS